MHTVQMVAGPFWMVKLPGMKSGFGTFFRLDCGQQHLLDQFFFCYFRSLALNLVFQLNKIFLVHFLHPFHSKSQLIQCLLTFIQPFKCFIFLLSPIWKFCLHLIYFLFHHKSFLLFFFLNALNPLMNKKLLDSLKILDFVSGIFEAVFHKFFLFFVFLNPEVFHFLNKEFVFFGPFPDWVTFVDFDYVHQLFVSFDFFFVDKFTLQIDLFLLLKDIIIEKRFFLLFSLINVIEEVLFSIQWCGRVYFWDLERRSKRAFKFIRQLRPIVYSYGPVFVWGPSMTVRSHVCCATALTKRRLSTLRNRPTFNLPWTNISVCGIN